MKEISKEINAIPLPNIPDTPHILLPPAEHSLIRNNFQIYSEELYSQYNNPISDKQGDENKLEDEIGLSKRPSMIGLKRREKDDLPNIISKKKMKLSQSMNEDEISGSLKGGIKADYFENNNISKKHSNNLKSFGENEKQGSDGNSVDMRNIIDQDDHNNFMINDNSDMDDYNYMFP
jgi:hypothetical protein